MGDSSDPVGPASTLFGKDFYDRCKAALKEGGILVTQGESIWVHLEMISSMMTFIREEVGFKTVDFCNIMQPTYPCGGIGFFVCTDRDVGCREPMRELPAEVQESLKMYDPAIHRATFVLPPFARKRLGL
eukprot:NODE_2725_length_451_cov_598.402985_g2259_i0.p1 GENE.NODE_2725_length_451_cov_598.402985_g2259_i0~~NODE_2725_length_451_cov_598.402985_g2259_i0.p1  ORF type:complete len:138 (-),score=29.81 NODE_2725_length_451_cov_598.402985_g2259_i0:36-425(-)